MRRVSMKSLVVRANDLQRSAAGWYLKEDGSFELRALTWSKMVSEDGWLHYRYILPLKQYNKFLLFGLILL